MAFGTPLYWRETHRQPRFLVFDGRLVILILLALMHIRPWTVVAVLTVMLILFYFERKGVSADSILRFLRSNLVGRYRSARGYDAERRPTDYGFETKAMLAAERIAIERHQAHRKAIAEKSLKSGKTAKEKRSVQG